MSKQSDDVSKESRGPVERTSVSKMILCGCEVKVLMMEAGR